MAKWKDGKLDLGALGSVGLGGLDGTYWLLYGPDGTITLSSNRFDDDATAKRSAETWLRRALKQASKRLDRA